MSMSASEGQPFVAMPVAPGVASLQRALLWSIGAGGAIVFVEPSPYELATLGAMIVFFATGLRLRLAFVPLLILLFCINLGYTICAAYMLDQKPIVNWILTSWYMAVTVIFFAMVFSEDTAGRLELLKRGLIVGGVIASLAGIAGYFSLFPGAHQMFTLYSRAAGTFKDPNVLSAFLILPALFALQNVVTERFGKAVRNAIALGIIGIALLLAFSRAAWGQMVVTSAVMLLLMFMTSGSTKQRSRIVIMTIAAVAVVSLLVLALLSMDSVGGLFKERASLGQNYDGGRFGRFGRHVLGAQMALDLPLGIGPLQFTKFMPEDTHNSYLNAFMSGGWISGVCYPALIFVTLALGFRYIFKRVPWQKTYLAVFAGFLGTVGESFIIDTDHWRHFWLMIGAMWGMFAATETYLKRQRRVDPPRA
ncbi:MAG: hypothetical protein JWQ51_2281 [Tardiphaga sp.]|nr:hypothetical protein [Tardiphaga sp.]